MDDFPNRSGGDNIPSIQSTRGQLETQNKAQGMSVNSEAIIEELLSSEENWLVVVFTSV